VGLDAVTARYVAASPGGAAELQRASLRWSPCDSPLHGEADSCLEEANALRTAGPDPYDDSPESNAFVELVFEVAVDALRELDAAGTFGLGPERQMLTLGIWKGDQSDEERVFFVQQLNDLSVADRFSEEVACANDAFSVLTGS
jgi:hypothetical protein